MPLFECSQCHCLENTALGEYWQPKGAGLPVMCSECATGIWHGRFPKQPAAGCKIDDQGFLWKDSTAVPDNIHIIGAVERHEQYQLTGHACLRVSERSMETSEGVLALLNEFKSVRLLTHESNDESPFYAYELVYSKTDGQFYCAVIGCASQRIRGGFVVTLLNASHFENSKGPISPFLLVKAAEVALTPAEYSEYSQLIEVRLRAHVELATRDQMASDAAPNSLLGMFSPAFEFPESGRYRRNLLSSAEALLKEPFLTEFSQAFYARAEWTPKQMRGVTVRLHYWDTDHELQVLNLRRPPVPLDHMRRYGIHGLHTHPAFWAWLAEEIKEASIPENVNIQKLEVYETVPKGMAPVELDLAAPLVEAPAIESAVEITG